MFQFISLHLGDAGRPTPSFIYRGNIMSSVKEVQLVTMSSRHGAHRNTASRGSVFMKNVENGKAAEFRVLPDQTLDAHGVSNRIGQGNRAPEKLYVLDGSGCEESGSDYFKVLKVPLNGVISLAECPTAIFPDYRAEPEMAEPEMAEPEIAEPEVAQNQAQPPDQHGAWQLPRLTISGMAKILCFILAILLIHAAWVYIVLVAQREGSGGQLVSQLYVPGLKSTTAHYDDGTAQHVPAAGEKMDSFGTTPMTPMALPAGAATRAIEGIRETSNAADAVADVAKEVVGATLPGEEAALAADAAVDVAKKVLGAMLPEKEAAPAPGEHHKDYGQGAKEAASQHHTAGPAPGEYHKDYGQGAKEAASQHHTAAPPPGHSPVPGHKPKHL